ncbi:jg15518 [Pararge aegeria aegeria]|uniref:Jg15518 protein n=1 Tax=Pararge aegeria aegeria TaxID=348720 RepID=A0A8S4SE89_9NEOP|nr:jg15518 [Pararge aegeria aegeria]
MYYNISLKLLGNLFGDWQPWIKFITQTFTDQNPDNEKHSFMGIEPPWTQKTSYNYHNFDSGITVVQSVTKIRLVKALIFPIFFYASETWTLRETEKKRIDALEMWCWRRMLGVTWNMFRTNESILDELSIKQRLSSAVQLRILSFFGHVSRRNDVSIERLVVQEEPRLFEERQPLEKSGEVLSSEPQHPDDDHDQSAKTETTKKKNSGTELFVFKPRLAGCSLYASEARITFAPLIHTLMKYSASNHTDRAQGVWSPPIRTGPAWWITELTSYHCRMRRPVPVLG